MLLSQDGIDLAVYDNNGLTSLHVLMLKINNYNVSTATLIYYEFMKHPNIDELLEMLDRHGLSLLDRFMCNKRAHSYDLDISPAMTNFLRLVLSINRVVTASGKTLALAGTSCSTSVFQILIDAGANPNVSLGDETAAHCVIERKSLAKCTPLFDMKPDLSVKLMSKTPVELAHIYECNREVIDIFTNTMLNHNCETSTTIALLILLRFTSMNSYTIGHNSKLFYHQRFL